MCAGCVCTGSMSRGGGMCAGCVHTGSVCRGRVCVQDVFAQGPCAGSGVHVRVGGGGCVQSVCTEFVCRGGYVCRMCLHRVRVRGGGYMCGEGGTCAGRGGGLCAECAQSLCVGRVCVQDVFAQGPCAGKGGLHVHRVCVRGEVMCAGCVCTGSVCGGTKSGMLPSILSHWNMFD